MKASVKKIRLRGARQNNLKGIDLDLPPGKLIVITGLSGDPAYAEQFHAWATTLIDAAVERYGLAPDQVIYLAEKVEVPVPAGAVGAAAPPEAEDPAFEASAAFAEDTTFDGAPKTPPSTSPTFDGARPGLVFKTGPQGVGYYSDPAQVHRCLVDPLGGRRLVEDGYPNFGMSVLGHNEAEVR